jgi:PST family polysaccharide transporter
MFFGPGIGIMLVYYTHGWIHLSIGRADRWLRWGFVELTVTGLLFLVGLSWGPVGIAVAWTVSFWVLTVPAFWYAGKPIQLGVGPVIAVVWKYVVASVLAGCVSAMLLGGIPLYDAEPDAVGAAVRIALTSTVFLVLYVSAVALLHRGFKPVHRIYRLLLEMLPGTRDSRPSPTPLAGASEIVS